jgi:glycerol kinase
VWPALAGLPPLLDGSERAFEPRLPPAERAELLGRWGRAVERARGWV